ncbi:MAG: type III pantothenate kinase [Mycoplasmataceae bacterium]|jgi:type III pantothenate kinase|nr:type III pantothenate kinase [Mycoplasmataceae bacterium]
MHRLIVDVGNTNIKFGLFSNDKLTNVICIHTHTYSYTKLKKILNIEKCKKIYVGSVVKELTTRLVQDLHLITQTYITVIKPIDFKSVFNLTKFPIKEIGVDILGLALIVKHLYNKGVGISFGTATFAIIVNKQNLIGAAIAPSINLGIRQLQITTSLIKKVNTKIGNLNFGKNTLTALRSGGSHMAQGFIMSIFNYAHKHYHINQTLITGGKMIHLKFVKNLPNTDILDNAVLLGYYQLVKTIWA